MRAPQQREPVHRPADPRATTHGGTDRDTTTHAEGEGVAEQLLGLQRTVGNTFVSRLVTGEESGVHEVLRSPGQPLADSVRADLEGRLGADFGDVRVHTGPTAERAADEVGARAWTSGEHVVIGHGGADRHTLAHELTHVIQQRSGPVAGTDNGAGVRVSDPADPFERAAEANADRVMSGLAPTVHDTDVARSHGAPRLQRITQHAEGGVDYELSQNGHYAIVDGERRIWALAGVQVSDALARNPAGDRTINGQNYLEYQISRWILKDCLHTAEEIINNLPGQLHSARELEEGEGQYSQIRANTNRLRNFGGSDKANIKNAKEFIGPNNKDASPGIGQAFVIIATKKREEEMSPYHAAAVVGVDGNDRVTLEEWDQRGDVSRGAAHMYTVGSGDASFHGAWGGEGAYFGAHEPITVVIQGVARPADLSRRTRDRDVFTANTFGDEADRSLAWPDSD